MQDQFYDTPLPTWNASVDGIFQGAVTGGIAYVGALMALASNRIWFKRVAGTSAGAVTAAMIAAGYNAHEIDYLAAPRGSRSGAPSTLPAGAKPLEYLSFLDPALSPGEVSLETRRNNMIYQAIEGPIADEILRIRWPLADIESFVSNLVNGVINTMPTKVGPWKKKVAGVTVSFPAVQIVTPQLKQHIKDIIRSVVRLQFEQLTLANTVFLSTPALKQQFADAVMSAILFASPFLLQYLHFLVDGGLFKGDALLDSIRKILEAKVGTHPVKFQDLTIPLHCVAADLTAHEMRVYGPEKYGDMEVAEAVRRSGGIPFFFDSRRDGLHEIVDGGIMDNYPVGLYLAEHNGFFTNQTADMDRAKFGFAALSDSFGRGFELERYLPRGAIFPPTWIESRLLNRAYGFAITNISGSPLLNAMATQFADAAKTAGTATSPAMKVFYSIHIDLGGHNIYDFDIKKSTFDKLCHNGWKAVIGEKAAIGDVEHGITQARNSGIIPSTDPLVSVNPYIV